MRTAARRDAIVVVAREMEQRGQKITCWTQKDAEAASDRRDPDCLGFAGRDRAQGLARKKLPTAGPWATGNQT
jgi:hypothetical protein